MPGTRTRARWLAAIIAIAGCAGTAAQQHTGAKPLYWYMTLDDAIRIALRNNRDLLDARLGRELDKLTLERAEDRYRPTATFGASAGIDSGDESRTDLENRTSLRIPTGGEITLRWSKPVDGGEDASDTYVLGFSQPLLRGRGTVDTAPLRIARLHEESRVLAFRDTIASVVIATIRAWRGLTRAERELKINESALERARRQGEVSRKLIEAGSMASREILQNEADIANRELALMQTRNSLTRANFALVNLLDVESTMQVLTLEDDTTHERKSRGIDEAIALALRNRAAYRRALLALEVEKIELDVAEDQRLWDLSLDVDATRRGDRTDNRMDYAARLNLSIPLWDRTARTATTQARADIERAKRSLEEHRQQIEIEVRQAMHDVEVGRERTDLARRARDLASQKLDIERQKLREGLSSSFQITRFEEDLIRAQNAEVDAAVSYEDALTTLDQKLGTTLERWGIRVEEIGR